MCDSYDSEIVRFKRFKTANDFDKKGQGLRQGIWQIFCEPESTVTLEMSILF